MKNLIRSFQRPLKWSLTNWPILCGIALTAFTILHSTPTWAATGRNINQTVPPTWTPAPEITVEPPTVTPVPPTEPPPTEPPATQPPATQPPATQPPSEPPPTQPPATQPPATQPPATQPPTTVAPPTQPPATQPPAPQQPSSAPAGTSGGAQGAGGSGGGAKLTVNNAVITTTYPTTATVKLTATVNVASLNVRAAFGTSAKLIGVIKKNTVIEIIGRNTEGDWWLMCCLPGTKTQGWVSSQFVTSSFDRKKTMSLIPVIGARPSAAPTATTPITKTSSSSTSASTTGSTTAGSTTTGSSTAGSTANKTTQPNVQAASPATNASPVYNLQVSVSRKPEFPLQGGEVTLEIVVTNPGALVAKDVELRNELPSELIFVDGKATNGGTLKLEKTKTGRQVFRFIWSQFVAKSSVIATVRLKIDPSVPNGAVLDNLMYTVGSNVGGVTSGVTIGMPPAAPPEF